MMESNFTRFEIKDFIIKSIQEQGFTMPTEIQERLIPAIRGGKDVIGQSQTGSGKTLAFLIPIIDRIDESKDEVQAVITAPTRELASQIYDELQLLLKYDEDRIATRLLVGGTDRLRTIDRLKSVPHIVVGTPGRINDMVDEQALQLHTATMLVVDEADQMLDMGFISDVDKTASRMAEQLQMLVFSATIPEKLQPFLKKYMNQPRHVHVKPKNATAPTIEHRLIPLRHRDKIELTVQIATLVNPYLALLFTNTKEQADELTGAMASAGLNVEAIHGGLLPRQRKQVMKQVKDGKIQYVVATDLAARGLDIKGVSHVINFAIPKDLDFYVHRVGRTARAGEDGIAITIYDEQDHASIEKLMKRGIDFSFSDVKKGEWVELEKPRLGSLTRTKKTTSSSQAGHGVARAKPKKVKPGYKKKARWEQEKVARRERRLNRKKK
ncbi:DEAD/DEAH box helicase [Alkalihalobacillus sp. LMS39]|uniref:DEAD/DEAH box helicase n=1 Tax=Alkalihalobacillus sp. LMS39 TaxID=2924032 RepID=UPI001FB37D65|nr:DEAD/DEAH box helicase [Alkalihalobacillus sp. LMS39]UOE95693.1 DEAD/DEAH box helicase [Alkalihalobacillus sp. LMS39]